MIYFDAVAVLVLDELLGVEIHLHNTKSTLESTIFLYNVKRLEVNNTIALCIFFAHPDVLERNLPDKWTTKSTQLR